MGMMIRIRRIFFAFLALVSVAAAHPGVINLYVNPTTNQLFPFEPFDPATLALFEGIEISAPFPGFGISFPANGVAIGEELKLQTTLGLIYWDGADIVPTSNRLTIEAPTFDNGGQSISNSFPSYMIEHNSINQTGMTWGTYSGDNFWEADGLYFLDPLDAPAGIYGLAAQIDSPSHDASRPFLFPFVFDPQGQLDPAAKAAGIVKLRQVVHSDINDDGLLDCQDIDLLVQEIVAQTNTGKMDLTLDGVVDVDDLDVWLEVAGGHNLGQSYRPGDANLDGNVDGSDFLIWNTHKFSAVSGWCQADFTADGQTDGSDFLRWNDFKFESAAVVAVPEACLPIGCMLFFSYFLARIRPSN